MLAWRFEFFAAYAYHLLSKQSGCGLYLRPAQIVSLEGAIV